MTQDEIRRYLAANGSVRIQVAAREDGSPEMAWGDTFCFAVGADGQAKKMPFVTIVTKDYAGFDEESRLDRGLYRVNLDVGKAKFEALFGFAPRDLADRRGDFDFAAVDTLIPHPTYGANGWVSIVEPGERSRNALEELLAFAIHRATH
ncbi:DUF6194 family protein [Lysobacter sp. ESA13C]|uniref:DUF6194 family protein n=1 Tax=Lysobacter sp. ESA13C TaxID=2862676 RepID=UPI001CC022E0